MFHPSLFASTNYSRLVARSLCTIKFEASQLPLCGVHCALHLAFIHHHYHLTLETRCIKSNTKRCCNKNSFWIQWVNRICCATRFVDMRKFFFFMWTFFICPHKIIWVSIHYDSRPTFCSRQRDSQSYMREKHRYQFVILLMNSF